MKDNTRVVAVGLLTEFDLERLGSGFDRAWPVETTPCFGDILARIDAADRELWRARDREQQVVMQPPRGSPRRS